MVHDNEANLSENAVRILALLKTQKNGQATHRSIQSVLQLEEKLYGEAKVELLAKGVAVTYEWGGQKRKGGGLRLPAPAVSTEVDQGLLESAKKEEEAFAEKYRESDKIERAEKELYPYIEQWANNSAGFPNVKIVGDNHRRSSWENPDLIAWAILEHDWLVGYDIEITTFEVKLKFDVFAIWQAAHYRRFAHYVYLACYEKPDQLRSDRRLYNIAVELGLGIISMTPAGAGARGVRCDEVNSPIRQIPITDEIDSLLEDYKDLLELTRPGKLLIGQMDKLD